MPLAFIIGSANAVKVRALEEALLEREDLRNSSVGSVEVPSGVSAQPRGLEETYRGAMNRALAAAKAAPRDIAVGIESGIFAIPRVYDRWMDVSACALYVRAADRWLFGQSAAFEVPAEVCRHLARGYDLSGACRQAGLTDHPYVGAAEGIIGILSGGRVTRKEYTIGAVRMALLGLDRLP